MPGPLPVDNAVTVGKLDNGLTYYIRHNDFQKGQVDFYIAQKVGAVQEDENQRGLAHFLEHMCFNGTKNFPGDKMIKWAESRGIKFGYNMNAYTACDRTVYNINDAPNSPAVVDSCLLILHDWASALSLDGDEIDKERGVIHEEWRRSSAFIRLIERNGETMFSGSKYGSRLPIGLMDVVDNFPHDVLRNYYHKWYRPDLQGIVIVGDIDVKEVEAKVQKLFGDIKNPENEAPFEYFPVPDNDETVYVVDTDPEFPAKILWVNVKFDGLPREMRNTVALYSMNYMGNIIQLAFNERLSDIAQKADAPFTSAHANISDSFILANTKSTVSIQVQPNAQGYEVAYKAILTELRRLALYGITSAELQRASDELFSQAESAYSNRDKQKNSTYSEEYVESFLENYAIPGAETEYQLAKAFHENLNNTAMFNQMIAQVITGKNMAVYAFGPEKEKANMPTIEALQAVEKEVNGAQIEAPVETAVAAALIEKLPKKGKITKEVAGAHDSKILTLKNGATVILKKTTFKENEVLIQANSKGGESLLLPTDHANVTMFNTLWARNGVAGFSYTDLQKALSGKQASCGLAIGEYNETISAKATPKDLETALQLLYLQVTQPRNNKAEFDVALNNMREQLKHVSLNPSYVFADSLAMISYNHNPSAQIINEKMCDQFDYARTLQIVKERFGNAADFTFYIVGNFDEATIRTLVEQYIGALPGKKGKEEVAKDFGLNNREGQYRVEFNHKSENNVSQLGFVWTSDLKRSLANSVLLSIATSLASENLHDTVREEEGAAYSPYARSDKDNTYKDGVWQASVAASFEFSIDKKDKVYELTEKAWEDLATTVKQESLDKQKEFLLKNIANNEQNNSYWIGVLSVQYKLGIDMNTPYRDFVKNVTTDDIKAFVKDFLKSGNRAEIIMLP